MLNTGPLPRDEATVIARMDIHVSGSRQPLQSGRRVRLVTLLCTCAGLPWCEVALAHLGGDVASVELDRAALNGRSQSATFAAFDVHEIAAGSQTVREFVRSDGTVFALSWSGPVPPDLQTLLGPYFGAYSSGLAMI